MKKHVRIYMAGPLFTLAERSHNQRLAQALHRLNPALDCLLPQTRAAAFLPDLQAVAEDCWEQIRQADVVVACLEGSDADSGTSAELGFAKALNKPVIGYRTDFRGCEVDGLNAILRYGCNAYVFQPCTLETPGCDPLEQLAQALALEVAPFVHGVSEGLSHG